jgi:hypothetical protein
MGLLPLLDETIMAQKSPLGKGVCDTLPTVTAAPVGSTPVLLKLSTKLHDLCPL